METTIKGTKVTGSPAEISELLKLVGTKPVREVREIKARKKYTKLTDEQKAFILESKTNGTKPMDIAKALKISASKVSNFLYSKKN